MSDNEQAAFDQIMRVMLSLNENERANVFLALKFNRVFCVHCGWGSEEKPNDDCQCLNDE